MRFMLIVKANDKSEAGVLPTEKELADMGKFNEEMIKNGMMLAGEGLQASSKGARVKFTRGQQRAIRFWKPLSPPPISRTANPAPCPISC